MLSSVSNRETEERERLRLRRSRQQRSDQPSYTNDPARFILECVRIDNAQPDSDDAPESIPFVMWPAQRALLDAIVGERLTLILKARQLGISWLVLAYALWLCLYRGSQLVLVFSIGQGEANEMMRRVNVMYWRLPDALRATLPQLVKENTEEMRWANGSAVQSLPSRKSAGSSYTASLVILDEFGKNPNANAVYTAVKPTIDGGGKMIVLSSANGSSNLFYELVQKALSGLGRFAFRFLPWQARPGRDADWYAAVAADAIDESHMKQEYPASPDEAFEVTEVGAFLADITLWDACKQTIPPLDRHTPIVLAMDAGESSDTFALVAVSRHPTDATHFAVRWSRAYTPNGQALDFDQIEADIRAFVATYAVRELTYDRFLLGQMMRRFRGNTPLPVPIEPFTQAGDRLVADKALSDSILTRTLAHDGTHHDLRDHLSNANVKITADGRQLRIIKRKHALKIDLAVALSMALARAGEVLPVLVVKPKSAAVSSRWAGVA